MIVDILQMNYFSGKTVKSVNHLEMHSSTFRRLNLPEACRVTIIFKVLQGLKSFEYSLVFISIFKTSQCS